MPGCAQASSRTTAAQDRRIYRKPRLAARRGEEAGQTISQAYKLEYGEAVVEVHKDTMQPGEKVLLVDDLLATGGTAEAASG